MNISLISAYKNPQPDPLQAALEARNFGQVLEQMPLLDRANSYNASILTRHPRLPQGRGQKPARAQSRAQRAPRHGRRAGVAEDADQQLHRVREAALPRPQGQGAAAHRGAPPGRDQRLAARGRDHAPAAGAPPDRSGGRRQRHRRREHARPGRLRAAAGALHGRRGRRQHRARPARHAVRLGRRGAGRLRLLGSRLVGLRPGRAGRSAALHGRALELGHAHLVAGDLAPGDLVFFHGLGHVGHVHRRRQLRARAAHRRRRQDLESGELQRLRRRCAASAA